MEEPSKINDWRWKVMSVFDKFLDAIKLNDDYDDDELLDDEVMDEDDFLYDDEPKLHKRLIDRFTRKSTSRVQDDYDEDDYESEPVSRKSTVTRTSPAAAQPAAASAAAKERSVTQTTSATAARAEKPARQTQSSKVTPMRTSASSRRSSSALQSVEVCVIRPNNMENTREIADTLIQGATVILNLEGLDVELAQRIIDFTSGSCYTLGGTLQKVSSYIFVLGASNVDITGDLQNIMGGNLPSVKAGY